MTIGYLAQVFPHLTMTFVYREVQALRAAGLDIRTFSTWKPDIDSLSEEAKGMLADTFYVFPLDWLRFITAHLRYLVTRPRRYLSTLWFCLTRPHKSLRNRLRTLFHFAEGVYMARDVERKNVRHLHAHFALNSTTIALVIARLLNITYSFTAHANDIFVNPILLPEKIKEAQFIIAISNYNKHFLHDIVPAQETLDKTYLVRYCIDVERFSPATQQSRNGRPTILAISRLVEKKGLPYLVKACKILVEQGHNFHCVIVGGGPQEPLLRQLVAENDLSKHVTLAGVVFQEHLKDYLSKADIFALPCIIASDGDMDGIPNTLMEAMAMEIPTISTTVSGIPELIEDHRTGLAVPPCDAQALARAIATLIDDEALRCKLGKAGRVKVAEEFEIHKNAHRLLSVFDKYVVNGSHSSVR